LVTVPLTRTVWFRNREGSALMRPIVILGGHPPSTTAATANTARFRSLHSSPPRETRPRLPWVSPYNMEDAVSQSGHAGATAPGFRHGGDGGRPTLRCVPCRRGYRRPQRRLPPSRRAARPGPDPRWMCSLSLPSLGIRLRYRRVRLRPHEARAHF